MERKKEKSWIDEEPGRNGNWPPRTFTIIIAASARSALNLPSRAYIFTWGSSSNGALFSFLSVAAVQDRFSCLLLRRLSDHNPSIAACSASETLWFSVAVLNLIFIAPSFFFISLFLSLRSTKSAIWIGDKSLGKLRLSHTPWMQFCSQLWLIIISRGNNSWVTFLNWASFWIWIDWNFFCLALSRLDYSLVIPEQGWREAHNSKLLVRFDSHLGFFCASDLFNYKFYGE